MANFIAVLAWVNFFALTWAMLLNSRMQENSFQVAILCVLFFIIALASTSLATKKEEPKK